MKRDSLKIGDVVWLKSGGPSMTIKEYSEKDYFICNWFENTKIRESKFNANQLCKVNPDNKLEYDFSLLTSDELKTISELFKRIEIKK